MRLRGKGEGEEEEEEEKRRGVAMQCNAMALQIEQWS
jgi:hypothetical protein